MSSCRATSLLLLGVAEMLNRVSLKLLMSNTLNDVSSMLSQIFGSRQMAKCILVLVPEGLNNFRIPLSVDENSRSPWSVRMLLALVGNIAQYVKTPRE